MKKTTERLIYKTLENDLKHYSLVCLCSPRGSGSTSVVKALAQSRSESGCYLDLSHSDDPHVQKLLLDPAGFLESRPQGLVIIDHVTPSFSVPSSLLLALSDRALKGHDLSQKLRMVIVCSVSPKMLMRSLTHRTVQLKGKAKDKVKKYSECLRIREYWGLSYCDVDDFNYGQPFEKLWMRGHYPESFISDEQESYQWRRQLIDLRISEDLHPDWTWLPQKKVKILWKMMSQDSAFPRNVDKFSESLDAPIPLINRYFGYFEELMWVRNVPAWPYGSRYRQRHRSTRTYIRDSGMAFALQKVNGYRGSRRSFNRPRLWQGFVLEQIIMSRGSDAGFYYYQDRLGGHIPILILLEGGELWGVMTSDSTVPEVLPSFLIGCRLVGAVTKFMIYSGHRLFMLEDDVICVSLDKFIGVLNDHIGGGYGSSMEKLLARHW